MARPRGATLNRDAFEDMLIVRAASRTSVAEAADIALSTLSGMAHPTNPSGASLAVAVRLAQALNCRVGTLFPELAGKVAPEAEAVPA